MTMLATMKDRDVVAVALGRRHARVKRDAGVTIA